MNKQFEHAENFKNLHTKGVPLVLLNVWDAGSAKIVAACGAKAIATGSWAVAAAHGYEDGEKLPIKFVLQNLKSIIKAVDLPVTIDLESGYGKDPEQVANTIMQAVEIGAVGFNLEDNNIGAKQLYSIQQQVSRINVCRKALDDADHKAFINARTDVFLHKLPEAKTEPLLEEVISRANAYYKAGADGLFVPGLIDEAAIKTLCETSPLPINIMMLPDCPAPEILTKLGVSRISFGPGPFIAAMDGFTKQASALYS